MKRRKGFKSAEYFGFTNNQVGGLFLLIVSYFVVTYQKDCNWYNLVCHAQNITLSSAYTLIGIGLGVIALWFLLDKPDLPFI
jgi:hypothetical protein